MEGNQTGLDKKPSSLYRKCCSLLLGAILVSCFVAYLLGQSAGVVTYDDLTTEQTGGIPRTDLHNTGRDTDLVIRYHPQIAKPTRNQTVDSSSLRDKNASSAHNSAEPAPPRVANISRVSVIPRVVEPPPSPSPADPPRDVETSLSDIGKALFPRTVKVIEPSLVKVAESATTDESIKMILILAYQRVGSTFMGSMFDNNPSMLYIYEPLDSIYSRLYGTKKGWAVPMDLHFNWDRTYREMPAAEKTMVSHLIEQIMTCDFDNMISEYLVNEFWTTFTHKAAQGYVKCIKDLRVGVTPCQGSIRPYCPGRIGENLQKQVSCGQQISSVYDNSASSYSSANVPFQRYKECMDNQRGKVMSHCISKIKAVCEEKKTRVIKTVRLEADTIEELKLKYPGLKIIHLIRDPRAVALSRMKVVWATLGSLKMTKAKSFFRGRKKRSTGKDQVVTEELVDDTMAFLKDFAGMEEEGGDLRHNQYPSHLRKLLGMENLNTMEDLLRETPETDYGKVGQLYCYLALKDKRVLHGFEEKYPGTVYELVYEKLVTHPQEELENVYSFIDEPIPKQVKNWLRSSTGTSKHISEKWKRELTDVFIKDIDKYCHELYEAMDYR